MRERAVVQKRPGTMIGLATEPIPKSPSPTSPAPSAATEVEHESARSAQGPVLLGSWPGLVHDRTGSAQRSRLAITRAKLPRGAQPEWSLPLWRVDFKKADPSAPNINQPPSFYRVRNDERKPETPKIDSDGVLRLAEIPIKAELHEGLLNVLGDEGLTCVLENRSSVLTRNPPSASHQPDDDIPLQTGPPADTNVGWVEVNVPEKVTKDRPGTIKVSIHHWGELSRKVGAGVFRGSLTLILSNKSLPLQGGEAIRVSQPLAIVISGSRVIAVKGPEALGVGVKPEFHVAIESVETDEPNASYRLDPGWWLELNEAKNHSRVARLPLPLQLPAQETDPGGKVRFRLTDKEVDPDRKTETEDRGWDTVEVPRELGYDLADEWRDQLILQHLERGPNLSELPQVRIHRHQVDTYLPACYEPGTLEGLVYWDTATADKTAPLAPSDPTKPIATRRSLGSIKVASGLNVSTNMPITGEVFSVSAVIETGTDLTQEGALKEVPDHKDVELLEDPANPTRLDDRIIRLDWMDVDPSKPTIARYQGRRALQVPGHYQIRVYRGGGPTDEPLVPFPPNWPDISQVNVPLSVLIEGEPKAPPFEDENPLKVFTGGEPPWWVWGEPNFETPHENFRPPEKRQTNTNQAMSFRLAPGHTFKSMHLRYEGVFFDPAANDPPTSAVRRYSSQPPNPALMVFSWNDKSVHPRTVEEVDEARVKEGASFPLDLGGDGPRPFFDLQVSLKQLSADQLQLEQKAGKQLRLARFVFMGLDGQGRPIGRVYSRRFKVVVRSLWDELMDAVPPEVLALLGVGVVLGIAIIYRIRRRKLERKRKALAAKAAEAEAEAEASPASDRDYFSGLEPHDGEAETSPAPAPAAPKTPRAPTTPSPKPEPSYFDDLGPGEDSGAGSKYFD